MADLSITRPNSLQIINPELAKEWHPEKNGDLTANDVSAGSNKKVWWLGKCGHEWEAQIYNRVKGSGCPICGREKKRETIRRTLLEKSESLLKTDPELAEEWHPTKNGSLTADDVSAGSNKKVWWLGKCGHEWQATVCHRTSGRDCPICGEKSRIESYIKTRINKVGSLLESNPELAKEWHPTKNGSLTANDVSSGSSTSVWWLGECGHEWRAKVNSRAKGKGCPICAGKIILPGFNDLLSKYPFLAEEWHPTKNGTLMPTDVAPMSERKVWWLGKCGHEWEMPISHRTSQGQGCPICAGERKTSFPEQAIFYYCLLTTNAINRYLDHGVELDVYLPEQKAGIEYDGMRYHNSERAIQKEKYKNKYFQKVGIKIIRIKESTANRIENDVIFYKYTPSLKHLPWAITAAFQLIGIEDILPTIDLDRDRGRIYAQYIQTVKENSLAAKYPDLVTDWDYAKNQINPSMIPAASNKKVFWKCVNGHEWSAQINSRIRGSGCPICAGKKVLPGYNDLATLNPKLAKEWHPSKNFPLLPSDVTLRSGKRVWWICENGHEWNTTIHTRTRGCGCPICGEKARHELRKDTLLKKKGSLQEVNPELAKEWHPTKNGDLTPHDVTTGSNKKVWWLGKCGHEWYVSPHSRGKGSGCPICAGKKQNQQQEEVGNDEASD